MISVDEKFDRGRDDPSFQLKHTDCLIEMLEASKAGTSKFDIIDLDPFGSSLPYLQSAFKGIKHQGIIGATFTDLKVIEGFDHHRLFSLYGARRGDKIKNKEDFSLRLVLASINNEANKVNKTIRPLISIWKHFYLRVSLSD